ncbi:zinc finger, CCHC-type containing protein [Tanacetum coccineum]
MKEDETIDTFNAKLTTLVNKAASLGHTMEDETLVRKLLNVIPYSKVLCFKCKECGHFANKCPSKKEKQSNLIEEDLEPTLLMVTVEEAPGSFINQEESRSKNGRKFHSASN